MRPFCTLGIKLQWSPDFFQPRFFSGHAFLGAPLVPQSFSQKRAPFLKLYVRSDWIILPLRTISCLIFRTGRSLIAHSKTVIPILLLLSQTSPIPSYQSLQLNYQNDIAVAVKDGQEL